MKAIDVTGFIAVPGIALVVLGWFALQPGSSVWMLVAWIVTPNVLFLVYFFFALYFDDRRYAP